MPVKFYPDPLRFAGVIRRIREKPILCKSIGGFRNADLALNTNVSNELYSCLAAVVWDVGKLTSGSCIIKLWLHVQLLHATLCNSCMQ